MIEYPHQRDMDTLLERQIACRIHYFNKCPLRRALNMRWRAYWNGIKKRLETNPVTLYNDPLHSATFSNVWLAKQEKEPEYFGEVDMNALSIKELCTCEKGHVHDTPWQATDCDNEN